MTDTSPYKLRLPSRFISHLEGSGANYGEEGTDPALIALVQQIVKGWKYGEPSIVAVPFDLVADMWLYAETMQPESGDLTPGDPWWGDQMAEIRAGRSVIKQIDKIDSERGVSRYFGEVREEVIA